MFTKCLILCMCLVVVMATYHNRSNVRSSYINRIRGLRNKRIQTVSGESVYAKSEPQLPDETVFRRDFDKKTTNNLVTMTDDRIEMILTRHNAARASVNPIADPPLTDMTWDSDLAIIASGWASKCTIAHNIARSQTYDGYVGENVGWSTSDNDVAITSLVDDWINEKIWWTFPQICNAPVGESCGHYTQVIWDFSTKVGCGMAVCGRYRFFVCNYSKGGNYRMVHPYEKVCL